MYSGKTTEMLRRLERAYYAKKKVILVRPNTDTREFLSHSQKDVSWLTQTRIKSLGSMDLTDYEYIGIDEGQFQSGLKEFCLKHKDRNIIISALHATSECEMFEQIIDIMPYCEKILKLNAVCTQCGAEYANYTYYLAGNKTDKVAVGGSESYTALCCACYNENIEGE
jgi:thymidine kinase